MTLVEIEAQEKELAESKKRLKGYIFIIQRQLDRLSKRRHLMLTHPNWEQTVRKAADKGRKILCQKAV